MRKLLMAVGIAASTVSPLQAQEAFGIRGGAPISSLKVINGPTAESPYFYSVIPPVPNAEAESFHVTATPETGVCKVMMVGKSYDGDKYGSNGRAAFQKFYDALVAKYGKATNDYDLIRASSIWDEPEDYAMSLRQDDRMKASLWDKNNLPTGFDAIALQLKAVSGSTTYLSLTYEFSNFDQCQALMKAKDTAGI